METLTLEHLPVGWAAHVGLFLDVDNAAFLHEQLLARNTDFEYAFVDASVVVSRLQLLSAVFKSVTGAVNGALKTPNVHSEIVSSLSPSNNIADSYRRFGVSPATKSLLVVKVTSPDSSKTPSAINDHLSANVQGQAVPVSDENIASATDIAKVRKYYKLNGLNWLDGVKPDEAKRSQMEALILSGMALRGL